MNLLSILLAIALSAGGWFTVDDFERDMMTTLGQTPGYDTTGAPWPGGNPWRNVTSNGLIGFGVDGHSLFAEASSSGGGFRANLDIADGYLPMENEAWELLFKYRLTTESVTPLGLGHSLFLQWGDNGMLSPAALVLDFGANNWEWPQNTWIGEGIGLNGDTNVKLLKPLGVGQWNLVRWQHDGSMMRARIWAEDDSEPATWDVEVAETTVIGEISAVTGRTVEKDELNIAGYVGNSSGDAQKVELDYIKARLPARSGSTVLEELTADGSSTQFYLRQDFQQVRKVTVDGISVDVTESTPTITFDRAPSSGAVIEVTYIAS